jgi:anti-sigma-K factor RskA
MDRFDAAFRSWAERPPRTAPEEAARRLGSRLPERRLAERRSLAGRPKLWLAAAAVALAAGLALVVGSLGPRWERREPAEAAAPPAAVPLAPAGDVLVIELDPETTLYLDLSGGDEPRS